MGARRTALALCSLVLLTACAPSWAPVEERSSYRRSYELTPDGRYRVRRGDTLHAIAFNFGLDWRDVARWNAIPAPYNIYPDQELRLSPPPARNPPPDRKAASTVTAKAEPATPPAVEPAAKPSEPPANVRTTAVPKLSGADPAAWLWPTSGRVLSTFAPNDPSRNGIEIVGSEGQPVTAAAAGEVVYSGNGLIGYGELIIIKHSDRLLSAYAHNKTRLVSEGQVVAAGEHIADMGRDERNKPMLHFEIRVNGTPQDPLDFLPPR